MPLPHRLPWSRAGSVGEEGRPGVALVRGGVGVALREHPVTDDVVRCVLLADAGSSGDDQLAVPLLGQADHELGVVVPAVGGDGLRVVREVPVDLDAGTGRWVHRLLRVQAGPVGGVAAALRRQGGGRQVVVALHALELRPRHLDRIDLGARPGRSSGRGRGGEPRRHQKRYERQEERAAAGHGIPSRGSGDHRLCPTSRSARGQGPRRVRRSRFLSATGWKGALVRLPR